MRFDRRLVAWLVGVAAFYAGWLIVVSLGDRWAVVAAHWPISVTMALGSYVAGATPMGGGTVGFPILVLAFHQSAELGRDFSFAVQSVGMTSASLFILAMRQPVEWPMLRWAVLGSVIGTPLGILFIAPLVPGVAVKVVFAVVWASFGVLHLFRLREFARHDGLAPSAHRFDRVAGLLTGLLAGATVAAVTGVGIDMAIYCVLVLLCQADLKIAIPTSVILMAVTSLIGVATKLTVGGGLQPGVFENWLAAAPVVVVGAPLGAFVVGRIGRTPTLFFVSVLCIGQFGWAMVDGWSALGIAGVAVSLFGVGMLVALLGWLHAIGGRWNRRHEDSSVCRNAATVRRNELSAD
jgi:uncharacterized membrane protein YfcA